jgi:hypothetical protein
MWGKFVLIVAIVASMFFTTIELVDELSHGFIVLELNYFVHLLNGNITMNLFY